MNERKRPPFKKNERGGNVEAVTIGGSSGLLSIVRGLRGYPAGVTLILPPLGKGDAERLDEAGDEVSLVPLCVERLEPCAELADGQVVSGELQVELGKTPHAAVQRIFLAHPVEASPEALRALANADVIILGPGEFYTGLIPRLLVGGVASAIQGSQALRLFICNLMTRQGETDDFKASDFIAEAASYLGLDRLDCAIVNNAIPHADILDACEKEGARLVLPAPDEVIEHAFSAIFAPLAGDALPLRHDPARTAQAIFDALNVGGATLGRESWTPRIVVF
ncbi:MAG: 2-phospho-L-lactate transferase CofD family protein [Chloroflexi bacterium]|nr:2-phospho-L-lactate transferase CofD family protein [Chloroflexota bacterium]